MDTNQEKQTYEVKAELHIGFKEKIKVLEEAIEFNMGFKPTMDQIFMFCIEGAYKTYMHQKPPPPPESSQSLRASRLDLSGNNIPKESFHEPFDYKKH